MSPDGKKICFNEPEAFQGIEAYFSLINKYSDKTSIMQSYETFLDNFFHKGDYCLAYTGPG